MVTLLSGELLGTARRGEKIIHLGDVHSVGLSMVQWIVLHQSMYGKCYWDLRGNFKKGPEVGRGNILWYI